jgi:large subunit ribosomal protein L5
MQRLKKVYLEDVVPILKKEFLYLNIHEVPKVVKIIINRGFGESYQNSKLLNSSLEELNSISGQKAVVVQSKKAVSGFKVREGMSIGMFVTLRRDKMYGFLDRLICLSLPRIRDFQGVNLKGFDGSGNFSFGLTEQLMFPEIIFDKVNKIQGMNISIVTNAKSDKEAIFLLKNLGLPFNN